MPTLIIGIPPGADLLSSFPDRGTVGGVRASSRRRGTKDACASTAIQILPGGDPWSAVLITLLEPPARLLAQHRQVQPLQLAQLTLPLPVFPLPLPLAGHPPRP